MCFSSPKAPVDNSAAIARKQEEERQARIRQGVSSIDSEFSNYNDDFYNKYQNDYLGYYTPQLEEQYGDARKRLTLNLAKTGNLNSQHGIDQSAKLKDYYGTQSSSVTNKALDAANALRGDVDSRKSQLYADARSSADPANAAAAARSVAQSLTPGQPSSPLANVFSDFFNNMGMAGAVSNTTGRKDNTGVRNYGSSKGSYVDYQ